MLTRDNQEIINSDADRPTVVLVVYSEHRVKQEYRQQCLVMFGHVTHSANRWPCLISQFLQ